MLRFAIESLVLLYARAPYHAGKWRVVEALIRAGGLEGGPVQTREVVRQGLKWRLSTDCSLQRRLMYHGAFDVHDARALFEGVRAGSVFFDIGSYFGYYSMLAAQRGASVYAFEPVGENFALLETQRALNGFSQVQTQRIALSDAVGQASFVLPDADNRGRGRLAGDEAGAKTESVEMTTLDAFAERVGLSRLDALKLDVEGAEIKVLAGGRETLRRFHPTMLIELNPPCLERFGASEGALLDTVRELGYAIFRATRAGLVPYRGLAAGESYLNIICKAK